LQAFLLLSLQQQIQEDERDNVQLMLQVLALRRTQTSSAEVRDKSHGRTGDFASYFYSDTSLSGNTFVSSFKFWSVFVGRGRAKFGHVSNKHVKL
jgi:hypothetical protein